MLYGGALYLALSHRYRATKKWKPSGTRRGVPGTAWGARKKISLPTWREAAVEVTSSLLWIEALTVGVRGLFVKGWLCVKLRVSAELDSRARERSFLQPAR